MVRIEAVDFKTLGMIYIVAMLTGVHFCTFEKCTAFKNIDNKN